MKEFGKKVTKIVREFRRKKKEKRHACAGHNSTVKSSKAAQWRSHSSGLRPEGSVTLTGQERDFNDPIKADPKNEQPGTPNIINAQLKLKILRCAIKL